MPKTKTKIDEETRVRPLRMPCQVCGELRPEEAIETLTFDVSKRFALDRLVYIIIDFCFDRRECKAAAIKRAKDFEAAR